MLSAVTYLTVGALLIRVQPRWRVKVYQPVPRHLDNAAGRHQSGLPRRPLADGRAGGLVRRRRLGTALLACSTTPTARGEGRDGHFQLGGIYTGREQVVQAKSPHSLGRAILLYRVPPFHRIPGTSGALSASQAANEAIESMTSATARATPSSTPSSSK